MYREALTVLLATAPALREHQPTWLRLITIIDKATRDSTCIGCVYLKGNLSKHSAGLRETLTDTRADQKPGPGTMFSLEQCSQNSLGSHKVNPLVRLRWECVQGHQEWESPHILSHRNKRPFVDGLRHESNPEHRNNPRNRAWNRQQVSLEGRKSGIECVNIEIRVKEKRGKRKRTPGSAGSM